MPDIESDLREDFRDALRDVDPPVNNEIELLAALPNGVRTRFQAGDFSMSVAQLATTLTAHQDFPYESIDELVDDVIEGLKEEDLI